MAGGQCAVHDALAGHSATDALETVLPQDPDRDVRHCAMVDSRGSAAVWTGAGCTALAEHRQGDRLYGLDSADMKGPVAAFITAARDLPKDVPVMLLLSCDEETTKAGARRIVA
ncbi:M20/M25/M40 family metallo-hydrolase [Celeribacter ethanolicus]|uniref:M20/M25/M40 family metallo-hydrolase n=1 Tax=Celeribacter ethanolicus TaxID=1758178 RepID=UPI000A4AC53F|nr:M20/M25/M40 family metallo-hydrolase [Celeribacter ethanolicus]